MDMQTDMLSDLYSAAMFLVNFLIVLSILVAVHELGHYLVAKAFRVRIETFSIGFGREIFGFNDRSGTRWKISLFPLGGYVKMFGDTDPEIQRQNIAAVVARNQEGAARAAAAGQAFEPAPVPEMREMSEAQRRVSFFFKPLYQRALIVAAGPAANLLLAMAVFTTLFYVHGEPYTPPVIQEVLADTAADKAGLKANDRILTVDGSKIDSFEQLRMRITLSPGIELRLGVQRGDETLVVPIKPMVRVEQDPIGGEVRYGQIGVRAVERDFREHHMIGAVAAATRFTVTQADMFVTGLWQIISGTRSVGELGGPVRIASLSDQAAKTGFIALFGFIAQLSISLALVNLLPIPVLDGGHLILYAFEAVRGRPLGHRAVEYSFRVGVALVLSLMIFVFVNDLRVLFTSMIAS